MGPREEGQCQPETWTWPEKSAAGMPSLEPLPSAPGCLLRHIPDPVGQYFPRACLASPGLTCLPRCASSPSIRIPITLRWNDY